MGKYAILGVAAVALFGAALWGLWSPTPDFPAFWAGAQIEKTDLYSQAGALILLAVFCYLCLSQRRGDPERAEVNTNFLCHPVNLNLNRLH